MKHESEPPPSFSNTPDAPVPGPVDLHRTDWIDTKPTVTVYELWTNDGGKVAYLPDHGQILELNESPQIRDLLNAQSHHEEEERPLKFEQMSREEQDEIIDVLRQPTDDELRQRLADSNHVTTELAKVDFSDAPEPTAEEVLRTTERLKQAGLRRLNELKEGKQ